MSTRLDDALAEAAIRVSDAGDAFDRWGRWLHRLMDDQLVHPDRLTIADLNNTSACILMFRNTVEAYRLALAAANALADVAKAEGE